MAKSSVKQVEKDEKKILEELKNNANKSINEIAETCGFSRQKVWRVIKNLEKNHTIWGYTAVVDEEKLDKKSYIMLMKRTNKPINQELVQNIENRVFVNMVKKLGVEFTFSIFTHGSFDWVICFNAYSMRDAKAVIELYNRLYEGYVSETHLLENIFCAVNCGVANPDIKKFGDILKI